MDEDNIPENVKAILDKPGRYMFRGMIFYFFTEVDDKGNIYQLRPDTLERDGLLNADGWNSGLNDWIIEPLGMRAN